MPFIRREGFEGLFYVPEDDGKKKKHPCRDCYSCQWCDDDRCAMCLKRKCCRADDTSSEEKT